MFCIRKVPPSLFTQFKKSYNKFQARFYSANYKLFILKSFDEYNALISENNKFQITSEKKCRKLLNLGEELINEFIELKRNNEIIMNEKLTFKEGYLIPNEIWNFVELYLERIFKCLRIECELFELSEKIKELDIRLTNLMNLSENKENNLLQQDNVDEEMDDTFIKLEIPRIIIKIVDLLKRRYNLLKRMEKRQDAKLDLNKAISLLKFHIEQVKLGKHYEGDMNVSKIKLWLAHLNEL